jgi:hypothetical protein
MPKITNKIMKLDLSNKDKIKALKLIKNVSNECTFLLRLLDKVFILIPNIHDKFNEKQKSRENYKLLANCDNLKRSIAFKIILDKLSDDINVNIFEIENIFNALCNEKMISMRISIKKYEIYAYSIAVTDCTSIEYAKLILTSDSILEYDEENYELVKDEVMTVISKNKMSKSSFNEVGQWDLMKADHEQILAYKSIMDKGNYYV